MPEGPARRNLEEAHAATTEAYERRVKGLDRVDILRRRVVLLLPLAYGGMVATGYGWLRRDNLVDYLGVRTGTVTFGLVVIFLLTAIPFVVTTQSLQQERKKARRRLEQEVERLEQADAAEEALRLQREEFEQAIQKLKIESAAKDQELAENARAAVTRWVTNSGGGSMAVDASGKIRAWTPKGKALRSDEILVRSADGTIVRRIKDASAKSAPIKKATAPRPPDPGDPDSPKPGP